MSGFLFDAITLIRNIESKLQIDIHCLEENIDMDKTLANSAV